MSKELSNRLKSVTCIDPAASRFSRYQSNPVAATGICELDARCLSNDCSALGRRKYEVRIQCTGTEVSERCEGTFRKTDGLYRSNFRGLRNECICSRRGRCRKILQAQWRSCFGNGNAVKRRRRRGKQYYYKEYRGVAGGQPYPGADPGSRSRYQRPALACSGWDQVAAMEFRRADVRPVPGDQYDGCGRIPELRQAL